MIQIYCKNTRTSQSFVEGTTLQDVLAAFDFEQPYQIVSAKVNNVPQGLRFRVYNNRDVEFIDVRENSGRRVYHRSLFFLLSKAAHEAFPGCRLYMEHPIANGYYCNFFKANGTRANADDVAIIREKMHSIVAEDVAFHRREVQVSEFVKIFRDLGYLDKVKLIETSGQVYMDYYLLGDTPDYYYGRLLPSAGYLKVWGLIPYQDGLLLQVPDRHHPEHIAPFVDQPKTFAMFKEALRWNIIMGLSNVGDVNNACGKKGRASELIQIAEALQEKKIVQIAEEIFRRFNSPEKVRLVLITGPTSSGKSTICKRLSIQLKACGLHPVSFSTDDYFVNRVETPKLPDGSYDFDNFDTVDHKALQKDVLKLLKGEKVQVPEYNFVTGIREYNGKTLELKDDTVLLIEGIHALNPALTDKVPDSVKYKIFINTITSISLDDHNSIATSDNRLLRRIVRDFNKGAFSARETISNWPNVRRSEVQWIYPYQENADVLFNSAYLVEFAVLRNHGEQILSTVPKNCPEYSEAHRLMKFLQYFTPVSDKDVPSTSLLRSFIGGSSL